MAGKPQKTSLTPKRPKSKPVSRNLPEHVIERVKALGFRDINTWNELRDVLALAEYELARRELGLPGNI